MQPMVLVATSYPHIVPIEGVGGLEIGDLGGDLGGFGSQTRTFAICGGGGGGGAQNFLI
jgi:hypothetical protein